MKLFLFFLICLFLVNSRAQTLTLEEGLPGTWQFTQLRQQGQLLAPPNPDLILLFRFDSAGNSDLFWSRKNQSGFCEHRGHYVAIDGKLTETVTWINPDNLPECSSDPDMQMGRETTNPYRLVDGKMEMDFNLGNDTLTYIWTRVDP